MAFEDSDDTPYKVELRIRKAIGEENGEEVCLNSNQKQEKARRFALRDRTEKAKLLKFRDQQPTCHYCGVQNSCINYLTCKIENCNRSFCYLCIKTCFITAAIANPSQLKGKWKCFVCQGLCDCSICLGIKKVEPIQDTSGQKVPKKLLILPNNKPINFETKQEKLKKKSEEKKMGALPNITRKRGRPKYVKKSASYSGKARSREGEVKLRAIQNQINRQQMFALEKDDRLQEPINDGIMTRHQKIRKEMLEREDDSSFQDLSAKQVDIDRHNRLRNSKNISNKKMKEQLSIQTPKITPSEPNIMSSALEANVFNSGPILFPQDDILPQFSSEGIHPFYTPVGKAGNMENFPQYFSNPFYSTELFGFPSGASNNFHYGMPYHEDNFDL